MPFDQATFAANLRAERGRKDLSQEQLANICGISQMTISSYENEASVPTVDRIADIADALGVSPNELLGWR